MDESGASLVARRARGSPAAGPSGGGDVGSGGAFNWLWLTDVPATEAALLVADEEESSVDELAVHFRDVQVRHPREVVDLSDRGLRHALDCVVVSSLAAPSTSPPFSSPSFRRLLTSTHQLLRPGGCLHVALERRGPVGTVERALRRAGFRAVRSYYSTPAEDGLRFLVPADRRVVCAFERARTDGTSERIMRVRAWMANVGLHGLLHRRRVFLARA